MSNKLLLGFALVCALFTLNAATPVKPLPTFRPPSYITVPASTYVTLELNEPLSANQLSVGNAIEFTVKGAVRIQNTPVVKNGARAVGKIKSITESCGGKCSQIVFTVEEVQAVDEQMIPLNSTPHVLKAPCCNGEALANIGTLVRAYTLTEVRVKQD